MIKEGKVIFSLLFLLIFVVVIFSSSFVLGELTCAGGTLTGTYAGCDGDYENTQTGSCWYRPPIYYPNGTAMYNFKSLGLRAEVYCWNFETPALCGSNDEYCKWYHGQNSCYGLSQENCGSIYYPTCSPQYSDYTCSCPLGQHSDLASTPFASCSGTFVENYTSSYCYWREGVKANAISQGEYCSYSDAGSCRGADEFCEWNILSYSATFSCIGFNEQTCMFTSGCVASYDTNYQCVSNTCSDTDGGYVPEIQGTVSAQSGDTGTDFCEDGYFLTEYYCSNSVGFSGQETCNFGCLNGECKPVPCPSSQEGVNGGNLGCIDKIISNSHIIYSTSSCTSLSQICSACNSGYYPSYDYATESYICHAIPDTCSDSDGMNYNTRGTVNASRGYSGTDYCADSGGDPGAPTSEGDILWEFGCSGTTGVKNIYGDCQYGCSEGKCNPTPPLPDCPVTQTGTIYVGCVQDQDINSNLINYAHSTNDLCSDEYVCFQCNSGYIWDGNNCVLKCPSPQPGTSGGNLGCLENQVLYSYVLYPTSSCTSLSQICSACNSGYYPSYDHATESYICVPVSISCTDTDLGQAYPEYFKGSLTATTGITNGMDNCADSTHLNEYFCDASNRGSLDSNHLCPKNYGCNSGACRDFYFVGTSDGNKILSLGQGTTLPKTIKFVGSAYSGSGGGSFSLYERAWTNEFWGWCDICAADTLVGTYSGNTQDFNGDGVNDYLSDSWTLNSNVLNSLESDGPYDKYEFYFKVGSYQSSGLLVDPSLDTCHDEIQNGGEEGIDCGPVCGNECLFCQDSDGGQIYDVQGRIIANNGLHTSGTDFCDDSTHLNEYYCSAANAGSLEIRHYCGAGNACSNGVCTGEQIPNSIVYWAYKTYQEAPGYLEVLNSSIGSFGRRLVLTYPEPSLSSFQIFKESNAIFIPDTLVREEYGSSFSNFYFYDWIPSYADFMNAGTPTFSNNTYRFYFKVDDGDSRLTSNYWDVYVIGEVPSCTDGAQNGDEEGVDCGGSCPNECEPDIDQCLGIDFCMDYTSEATCNLDNCSVAQYSGYAPSGTTPLCIWYSVVPEECIFGYSGSNYGVCMHHDSPTNDSCEDDGFLTHIWTNEYSWDLDNAFSTQQACEGYTSECSGNCVLRGSSWHCDPNGEETTCLNGETTATIPCPAQIQLGFFDWQNVVVAILVIFLLYLILLKNKKTQTEKSSKGKKRKK